MDITLKEVYREIKLLRRDVNNLKNMLVPEVEPEEDELTAVRIGRREYKAKQYAEWKESKK